MVAVFIPEQINPHSYAILSESIEESFLSIDRFEFQVSEELIIMRDKRIFEEGGYKSFEEYCEAKLSRWGGYRRVNQLIGAKLVIDSLKGTEFDGVIKRESHARPLLRLVKEPEKLVKAVALACQNTSEPIAVNFKEAAQLVKPKPQKANFQEQLFLKGTKVKVSSPDHPRHEEECVIAADAPNRWQQIVEFEDGERATIHNKELDAASVPYTPVERIPAPRTYTEEELQHLINRAIEEAKIGELSKLREQAEREAQEQLNAARAIASQHSIEVAKLRQQIEDLENLRLLEAENELLKQRIQDLENASEKRACQEWTHNTFTPEAAKVLNIHAQKVIENLEPDLDLRNLAKNPPKEKHREVLRLLGLSLANMALAMPYNSKLLEGAAAMWGIDADQVADKVEQLHKLPQAIASFRQTIQSNPTWGDILAAANKYPLVKQEVWLELNSQERDIVEKLRPWKNAHSWDDCKYQPLEQFLLIHNGERWLVVSPSDIERFDTPASWLEAYGKGEVEEMAIALADQFMSAYNQHATVTEVNPERNSIRVRWRERANKPSEYEWFFGEDLDQLRIVPIECQSITTSAP